MLAMCLFIIYFDFAMGAISLFSFLQREIGDKAAVWYTCQFLEMSSLNPFFFKAL